MTLRMADSIRAANLVGGYDAYLGYVDGEFANVSTIRRMFPGKPVVGLTVLGGHEVADGCDVERFDLDPASGAAWISWRIANGARLPIEYASVDAMDDVVAHLNRAGVARHQVRLLSAHYEDGEHICGPGTCGLTHWVMDGTQWTDRAPGAGGNLIDESALQGGFFGTVPSWEERLMSSIPTIKKGSTGQAVLNWQALLVARGFNLGQSGQFKDGVDGTFGLVTDTRTRQFQNARLGAANVDGIVGPNTWTAALEQ